MIPAFAAAVSPSGAVVDLSGPELSWRFDSLDSSASLRCTRGGLTSHARFDTWMAVGIARLHNRDEVRSWSGASVSATDLTLITAAIAARGRRCIRDLLGDFAVVASNPSTREALAARDAFGVKSLYYRQQPDSIAFASHAFRLWDRDRYDLDYLAEFILNGFDREHRSPYSAVRGVPPGHVLVADSSGVRLERYWSATEFPPGDDKGASAAESCATFRQLLERGVALSLGDRTDVWSQLSGGLDSSSVVCIADHLKRTGFVGHGLAGVVTMCDSLDDESPFARAVAEQCRLRHELVTDRWLWQNDDLPPPATDLPDPLYPFYARNRSVCNTVRSAGGKVLLSGVGPDHFLSGNLFFFADWLTRGCVIRTATELLRWSAQGKEPFWRFAFENAVEPLLPSPIRRMTAPGWASVPEWIPAAFARRLNLADRAHWLNAFERMPGGYYARAIASNMTHLPSCIDRGVFEDGIEMRYPYLYRPFVEFCLKLPRELRTQPFARKWILRQSMQQVLPEIVRTRRRKGGINRRVTWSLERERPAVQQLARAPILADLGAVNPGRLSEAVARASAGEEQIMAAVVRTLALEHWLETIESRRSDRGTLLGISDCPLAPAT